MEPKDIVRAGYDLVSHAYRADGDSDAATAEWVAELGALLPAGSRVLDLGCGCGVPATRMLAEHYQTVGVDISPVQIERARVLVPAASFLCTDMTGLELPAASFDAVVSLYALIHVPIEEQKPLLARIRGWLKPGGYLLATVGHTAWTGTEHDWLGVPGAEMYWSHADDATYARWLEELGFEVLSSRFVPEGQGGHSLVLARTRSTPGPG